MSHYVLLCIGDNIESLMEPYDENKQVEPYIDKTKHEVEQEMHRVLEDAQKPENADKDYYQKYRNNPNISLKEFAESWYNQELDDEDNLLTTYNQDSKYDWYSTGGRWQGMLKLKPNLKYPDKVVYGEWPWMDKDIPFDNSHADGAAFIDIDWDSMKKESVERALEHWNKDDESHPFSIKKQYKNNKRAYIRNQFMFHTYAVLNQDGWNEPGRMGWWGMSSATDEQERDWDDTFWNTFMKGLPEDIQITIIDCHI